jgi:hypothetical protein
MSFITTLVHTAYLNIILLTSYGCLSTLNASRKYLCVCFFGHPVNFSVLTMLQIFIKLSIVIVA